MMERPTSAIRGLHHVTAIASDPQANIDFYVGVLGLRLVKRTVNFDDPGTHHFYYGDAVGSPGSVLTFFPWPGARPGRRGAGQAATTSFSIPPSSTGWWLQRLNGAGMIVQGPFPRFDEEVISFEDHDGLQLDLVANADGGKEPGWEGGTVPAEHSIRRVFGVTLLEVAVGPTSELLLSHLGFSGAGSTDGRMRFTIGDGLTRAHLDLVLQPDSRRGGFGPGVVHHVAFRVADDSALSMWRSRVSKIDEPVFHVTPEIDRQYFRSIYFREPGGTLFELATDGPGFLIDETLETLGHSLTLPPWFEPQRAGLEASLPAITIPPR